MVSVIAASVVERELEPWSSQNSNHYKIGSICLCAQHTTI